MRTCCIDQACPVAGCVAAQNQLLPATTDIIDFGPVVLIEDISYLPFQIIRTNRNVVNVAQETQFLKRLTDSVISHQQRTCGRNLEILRHDVAKGQGVTESSPESVNDPGIARPNPAVSRNVVR